MSGRAQVAIYGAGGFAREVAWLVEGLERERLEAVGFVDDGPAVGQTLNRLPVRSWEQFCAAFPSARIAVAVGDPETREKLVAKCAARGYGFVTLVHPSAQMSGFNELGEGCIVCSGCILTVNIVVGRHVHINLDCTVGHDARIGDFSTLAPGIHVSGNVHIGKGVYIGTGANIINGTSEQPLTIGDGAVIGAGACVTQNAEPHALYAGVPAVLKKRYR